MASAVEPTQLMLAHSHLFTLNIPAILTQICYSHPVKHNIILQLDTLSENQRWVRMNEIISRIVCDMQFNSIKAVT